MKNNLAYFWHLHYKKIKFWIKDCPWCNGEGGEREDVYWGTGPFYKCFWCDGKGEMNIFEIAYKFALDKFDLLCYNVHMKFRKDK